MNKPDNRTKILLANGDKIDLEDFFRANYPVFCSFATSFVSDNDLCQDIVQDTFVKFWRNKNTFSNISAVKAFFYKSIRNSCLDYIKHEKVKDKFTNYYINQNNPVQYFWEEVIEKEAYSVVYQEINKLPEKEKEVLLLALKGKTNKEIAEDMNIAVNTVKTHKSRAYKVLRKKFNDLILFFLFAF